MSVWEFSSEKVIVSYLIVLDLVAKKYQHSLLYFTGTSIAPFSSPALTRAMHRQGHPQKNDFWTLGMNDFDKTLACRLAEYLLQEIPVRLIYVIRLFLQPALF